MRLSLKKSIFVREPNEPSNQHITDPIHLGPTVIVSSHRNNKINSKPEENMTTSSLHLEDNEILVGKEKRELSDGSAFTI